MVYDKINGLPRTLIETFVRQKLVELKNDPERSTRNLIDVALHFSEGRLQKQFLEIAQTMLQNEQSGYYKIIYDIAAHVDTEHLLRFGMNLGYNSLTMGAKIIRRVEDVQGINIPWNIGLVIDAQGYSSMESEYQELIEQGKKLGIYTYVLYIKKMPSNLFSLIQRQPDCVFILFGSVEEMTNDFLDGAKQLKNLMPVVRYSEGAANICKLMRKREMLYSVYVFYQEDEVDNILEGNLLYDIEQMHPVFTFFLHAEKPPMFYNDSIYQFVLAIRNKQEYQTIPMDLWQDICYIGNVISDEVCLVVFDENGNLYPKCSASQEPINFCNISLENLLNTYYRK